MCGLMALGLIGGVVGAIGSLAAAGAAANASEAQARAMEHQAAAERVTAGFNADQQRSRAIRLMSTQRAGFLSAGVDVSTGSPLAVIEDTTRQTELDVQAIRFNGELKAQNYDLQAQAFRAKAESERIGGVIGALSPIVKSVGGFATGGNSGFSTVLT